MIRILALSALLALNFANGASARPSPTRRQLSFLPLDSLSNLNPASNSASNTNTNSNSNPNPNDFHSVTNSNNGADTDANPAAFLSKLAGGATSGLNPGSFSGPNKRSSIAPRTAAKIPGFTGPSIEADVPSNLLPSVPTGRRRDVQNHASVEKRLIHNADFASGEKIGGSDVLAAVNANAASGPERRFIRNADYQEAGAPPSAGNAVVAAASAAEGTSA